MRSPRGVLPILIISGFVCPSLHAQMYTLQSARAGLQKAVHGNGVAAADYDNDGWVDFYYVSRPPYAPGSSLGGGENMLFKNNGDGSFTDVAEAAGVRGVDARSMDPVIVGNYGASWGDFDNDGDVDLFLTNTGYDELYENNGDGTFSNITEAAGVGTLIRESTSAVWFDYDVDGDLDLYVSAYAKYGPSPSQDNILYRNNGDGTFSDVTGAAGVSDPGFTFTTMVIDANLDGWPDIYCVNDFGANRLYVNSRGGTFREATLEFGLDNDGHGMGVAQGDYNNDGRFDLYLTNIAEGTEDEWNPLYEHLASGTYEDVSVNAGTQLAGWGWGVEFFDSDLDGHLDIYAVNGFAGTQTHNYFFHNSGSGTYRDMSFESGLASEAEARGLCVADFTNDGRLDIVVANWRKAASLFINHTAAGNYLQVELVGTRSNRDARGATITATVNGKSYHRNNDGIEFLGQSKAPIHFGFGGGTLVEHLEVRWPSGLQQDFYNLPANQTLTINEDLGIVSKVAVPGSFPPAAFVLMANYPNPVYHRTTLRFRMAVDAHVRVEVFDILGRLVAVPVRGMYPAGEHAASWNATDETGRHLPPGVYIQRITSGSFRAQRKLVVVR